MLAIKVATVRPSYTRPPLLREISAVERQMRIVVFGKAEFVFGKLGEW